MGCPQMVLMSDRHSLSFQSSCPADVTALGFLEPVSSCLGSLSPPTQIPPISLKPEIPFWSNWGSSKSTRPKVFLNSKKKLKKNVEKKIRFVFFGLYFRFRRFPPFCSPGLFSST